MAKLYFDIGANYEQVMLLTQRLRELERQMIQTDMATDVEGLKKLKKEYTEVSGALQLLVTQAAKSGMDIDKLFNSLSSGLAQTLSDLSENLQKGVDVTGKEMLDAYTAMSEEVETALKIIDEYSVGVTAALQQNSQELSELKKLQLEADNDIPGINEKIAKLEEEDAKYRDLQQSLNEHKKGIQEEAQHIDESIDKYDALAKKQAELIAQREESEENGEGISEGLMNEMLSVESEMQHVVGTFLSSGASMQQKISSLSGSLVRLGNQFLQNKLNATSAAGGMNVFQKASHKASLALVKMGMSAKGAKLAIAGLTAVLPTAAITLLVSAVIKLIQKFKEQKEAEEELRRQQLEYFKAISDAATDEVYNFLLLQNAWGELRTDMEKAQFLKDRKKDFENLGLYINDIVSAEDILINGTDAYISAQIKRAEADAYLEQAREKISLAIAKRQERDAADRNSKNRVQTGVDANGYAIYDWLTPYEVLDREYKALQDEIADLTKKARDASKQGEGFISSLSPIGPTLDSTIKEEIAKRKKEYEEAQELLDSIQKNQDKYTVKQLEDARKKVSDTKKAYEDLAGKESGDKEEPDRKKEFEKYAEKLAELARKTEESITNAEIEAMKDGDDKILAQQKLRREKALQQAEEINSDISLSVTDPKELDSLNKEYKKLVGTINRYYDLLDKGENLARSNQKAEENRQAEENYINSLLENYKSLEDEKMEIEADFLADSTMLRIKYEETGDEIYLRTLQAREKAHDEYLRKLLGQSVTLNPLIFANSESLSDTLLGDAITAVKDAINDCDPQNIEALSDLYDKLHRFQSDQNSRNDFGFASIFKGISDLNGDELKNLENLYKNETDPKKKQQAFENYLNRLSEAQQKIIKGFSDVGSAFSEFGSVLSRFDGALSDIGNTFSAIGAQSGILGEIVAGTMNKSNAIGAGISGVIQLGSMALTSIYNNKKAQEEWNKTVDECAQKYRMLALEALDYKQQNIFGVENPYKKAIDGAYQYGKAVEELQGQMADLNKGQVQTGTKKVVDWSNVGKGTAIGAAAGAAVGAGIFSAATAGIGAAIGAAVGAITGLLSTKTVPVLESLSSVYGELFDPDTYKLNDKILADYDKLDEDTKRVVDNWEDIREKALEAEQQMKDTFAELSGDVGKQLSDSLVDAFRNGDLYSAVDDFHNYMTGTIEDIVEQMIFNTVFQDMFDELEKRMDQSFRGPNADNDIADDLMWMENEYQNRLEVFDMYMKQAKDSLSGQGYDAWAKETENQSATGGGFQTMSQDTGTELNGRFTALQISGENIEASMNDIAENFMAFSERFYSQFLAIDDIRNIQAQSLIELQGINENTLLALKPIREMNATLGLIKTKVDKL